MTNTPTPAAALRAHFDNAHGGFQMSDAGLDAAAATFEWLLEAGLAVEDEPSELQRLWCEDADAYFHPIANDADAWQAERDRLVAIADARQQRAAQWDC